ncbi:zinc finger protein 120-like isoform X7 [Apodemus sylvaticus]|uniref:zinc finger protein 120-like isoform X7 n=1 Tax=Apodemus sylvaticus TaxID=10129 RepID=UPI00224241A9|nr:zinc finger protein 120-like isoform X7 [Apodemus sylvaticus]
MGAVTFDDVQVNFTEEERESLDPSQKNLYKNVMLATFLNLKALGSNWEDHDIEEHFENSRRFKRSPASRSRAYLEYFSQWLLLQCWPKQ